MAYGDIGAQLDSWNYETATCANPACIHISGTVYAIVTKGVDGDGFVRTFNISDAGAITKSWIDELEYDAGASDFQRIYHISGNVYAITYQGPGTDGFVCTVVIDSDGEIGASVIETLEFDTYRCYEPQLFHITGDLYLVAYEGPNVYCTLKTFNIDSAGDIGSILDTFEDTSGQDPGRKSVVNIINEYYLIATARSPADSLYLRSQYIQPAGQIWDTWVDSQAIHAGGKQPNLFALDPNKFLIVFHDADNDGYARTWVSNNAGVMDPTGIDVLEYETNNIYPPTCIHLATEYYASVGRDQATSGRLTTFRCTDAGDIIDPKIDTATIAGTDVGGFHILKATDTWVLIAHHDGTDHGYIRTIELDSPPTPGLIGHHELTLGIGP